MTASTSELSLKDRLIEIAQLLPDFRQIDLDLLGLQGINYDLAGIHANTGSPIENAYTRHEAHVGMLDQLAQVAADWGWDGAGEPVTWMSLNHDAHVQARGQVSEDHATLITRAHNTITRICKTRSDKARLPEETRALLRMHATLGHDIWVPIIQAADLADIHRDRIHKWKHRGQISVNQEGHVNLASVLKLAHTTT